MRANRQNDNNNNRTPPVVIDLTISPRAQREVERLQEYHRNQDDKLAMRQIIKIIQDKRREEFCLLREALGQVYSYTGRYLQLPGEKEVAAQLLRPGNLGSEFVNDFDNDAKWHWLQLRVNAL
ncbi:uncharacterized protein MELLADRAFT_65025 [Melampsora larici-populina 98AG31]|uniref:Uncharacterized protein n=1 Tax=Melampsora larici-populina (strain 98AG31 / pathotype 3-4-7) TaxID=747676 RepID=F4RTQ3_MELLP|nr:uncharacterized protein MELLADRAFT_65025 [Melampsora larici-populina 98AG31]EGG04298.1 hypothetical protein MELLADRAFT_65025 [Melampsora larici-populina 98AG31]